MSLTACCNQVSSSWLSGAAVVAGCATLPRQFETAGAKKRFMAPCCKQNLEPNIEAFVALATVHWSDLIIFTDSIFRHVSSVFQEGALHVPCQPNLFMFPERMSQNNLSQNGYGYSYRYRYSYRCRYRYIYI